MHDLTVYCKTQWSKLPYQFILRLVVRSRWTIMIMVSTDGGLKDDEKKENSGGDDNIGKYSM